MPLILSDVGATAILRSYLNKTQPSGGNNLVLKLYVNDVTPTDSHTAANYTEATGGNYSAITLSSGNWQFRTVSGVSEAYYQPGGVDPVFSFTGALTTNPDIYGYFVVDADNTLVWAERRNSTFTPAENGDSLTVKPKLQLSKGTPT